MTPGLGAEVNALLVTPPLGFRVIDGGEGAQKKLKDGYEAWERKALKSFESMKFALGAGAIRYGARIRRLTNLVAFGGNVWWVALVVDVGDKGGRVMIYFQPPMGVLPAEVLIFQKGVVDLESLSGFVGALCDEFEKG